MRSGSTCNVDKVADNLMHLKYDNGGGIFNINALGSTSANFTATVNTVTTAAFTGTPTVTLPTISDSTKEAKVILDFTTANASYPAISTTGITLRKRDSKALVYSTLSVTRNRLIFNTVDGGSTWEVELQKYGGTETAFTRPNLTANGTLGGSSFAVACTTGVYSDPYMAVDGSTSTGWYASTTPSALIIYNPNALKATSFGVQNNSDGNAIILGYTLYGSNDNTTYTSLISGTNSNTTSSAV